MSKTKFCPFLIIKDEADFNSFYCKLSPETNRNDRIPSISCKTPFMFMREAEWKECLTYKEEIEGKENTQKLLYLVLKLGFIIEEYNPIELFEDINKAKNVIKELRKKQSNLKYKYKFGLYKVKLERIYDDT